MQNKILLYTPSLKPGGVYNSNKLLAKGFKEKGYQVKIITNRKTNLEIEGFEHIHLNSGDFIRPFKLKNIILEERPIAIFSNLQTQNISLAIAKTLLKNNKTKFFGFIRTTDASLKYNSFFNLPFRRFVRFWYKKLDGIIAVSSAAKKDIVDTFKINEDFIKVIPNPIDITLVNLRKKEPLGDREKEIFKKKTIVYVGRFAKGKNVDLLIKAFKKIKDSFKDVNLVLVGDGEEKQKILNLIKNDTSIYLLNFTSNPFKYMFNSTIFAFTSRDEGFPRAVVEAFACGTPVVAFKNEFSGHRDIIDDGKNGFLVPYGDIEEFANKILKLLKDDKLREKFSRNAFEKSKEFELGKIISKLEELIYR